MNARTPLPARKLLQNAVSRARNYCPDRDQAIAIVCKRRGLIEEEVRALLAPKPRAKAVRKTPAKPSVSRAEYDAKINKLRAACQLILEMPREQQSEVVHALAEQYKVAAGRVWAVVGSFRPRSVDPTEEEIRARCAELRKRWGKKRYQSATGTTIRQHVETQVASSGVLNGRAGSWSAYE